jgi:hypothetical protein
MSIEAMRWVWENTTYTGNKLNTLVAIASFLDASGHGYPGIDKIRERCHLSKNTVLKFIAEYEDEGVLSRDRRNVDKGYRTSNEYHLTSLSPKSNKTGPRPKSSFEQPKSSFEQPKSNMLDLHRKVSTESQKESQLTTREGFDSVWDSWPRKENKRAAKKAFEIAMEKSPDERAVINRILVFGQIFSRGNPKYVPGLARWLDDERWNDELPRERAPLNDSNMDAMVRLSGWINATPGTIGGITS